jgi:hypothetical protein
MQGSGRGRRAGEGIRGRACWGAGAGSYHHPVTRLEILQPFVEKTVAEYLGIEQVQVWEDGTIPIRSGTTIVNVRLVQGEDPSRAILQVYSPMLREIGSCSRS